LSYPEFEFDDFRNLGRLFSNKVLRRYRNQTGKRYSQLYMIRILPGGNGLSLYLDDDYIAVVTSLSG